MKLFLIIFLLAILLIPGLARAQNSLKEDNEYQLYLTQIAAAEAFLHLNLISTANSYLNSCNEKYRNMEWQFLKAALDQSEKHSQKPETTILPT